MIPYVCVDGDRLDTICQKHYGHLNGTVEAVLAVNKYLADNTQPVFSTGYVIYLPQVQSKAVQSKIIKLWD